jgi:N-acetylglucosaminyl-diphospho-decaprenol L-rhamnosyltransferase
VAPRVDAILVSWNSGALLPRCLEALRVQTLPEVAPLLVDNGSADDSVARFRAACPGAPVIANPGNRGFAAACNQGIAATEAELILLLNTDCFLEPDYLETLVEHLAGHPGLGGVQGKYLRADAPGRIDSLGLRLRPWGPAKDIARGRPDPRTTEPFAVDGLCAAAALYRRRALADVAEAGAVFDADFGSYYEDVDLSLRLRAHGWQLACVPAARALHVRGAAAHPQMDRLALRNKYFALIKNLPARALVARAPLILGFELLKCGRFLLTSRASLKGYADVARDLPLFLRKRAGAQRALRP